MVCTQCLGFSTLHETAGSNVPSGTREFLSWEPSQIQTGLKKGRAAAIFVGLLLSLVAVVLLELASGYDPTSIALSDGLVVLLWFGVWWNARRRSSPP